MPKKPLSTILEAIEEEDEEIIEVATPTAEEEIPEEEILKRKKILFIVCPFCGMHRVLEKKGTGFVKRAKKENIDVFEDKLKNGEYIKSERSKFYNPNKQVAFNLYNFKEEPFISIRVSFGKNKIYEVGALTIKDIFYLSPEKRKKFIEYIKQLKKRCEEFLDYLKEIEIEKYF